MIEQDNREQIREVLHLRTQEGLEQINQSFMEGRVLEGHKRIDILLQMLGESTCEFLSGNINRQNARLVWDIVQTRVKPTDINYLRNMLDHDFIQDYEFSDVRSQLLLTLKQLNNQPITDEDLSGAVHTNVRYVVPNRHISIVMSSSNLVYNSPSASEIASEGIDEISEVHYQGGEYFYISLPGGVFSEVFMDPITKEMNATVSIPENIEQLGLFALGVSRLLDLTERNDEAPHRTVPAFNQIRGLTNLKVAKSIERYGFKAMNLDYYESEIIRLQQDHNAGRITEYAFNEQYAHIVNTKNVNVVAETIDITKHIRQQWQGFVREEIHSKAVEENIQKKVLNIFQPNLSLRLAA